MHKSFSSLLGIVISSLAAAHMVTKNRRLLGEVNVDKKLTAARIPLAISLLGAAVGPRRTNTTKKALAATGVAYVGLGLAGLFDRKLGGQLPKGLSAFDIAFHLAAGVGALALAAVPAKTASKR